MFKKILIIGFGMIGCSIAKSLQKQKKPPQIIALDKDPYKLRSRLKKNGLNKIISTGSITFADDSLYNVDLIIICTPILQYEKIFEKIERSIDNRRIIVTDVGSTKSNIEKLYLNGGYTFRFVPSHPIAGIEKSGLEHGSDNLFQNRYNIICPIKNSNKADIKKISNFWKKLSMKIEFMSARQHDNVMSLTSHLPHLISYSLVLTALKKEKSLKSKLVKFSAGGFRDFTRVAGSDPEMWRDIFLANNKEIQKLTNKFIKELHTFSNNLESKNSIKLLEKLKKTKKGRERIVKARQAGKFIPND